MTTKGRSETERRAGQDAAQLCIELINKRRPLNDGERDLLASLENDIRISFGLKGAVQSIPLSTGEAPETWFW